VTFHIKAEAGSHGNDPSVLHERRRFTVESTQPARSVSHEPSPGGAEGHYGEGAEGHYGEGAPPRTQTGGPHIHSAHGGRRRCSGGR